MVPGTHRELYYQLWYVVLCFARTRLARLELLCFAQLLFRRFGANNLSPSTLLLPVQVLAGTGTRYCVGAYPMCTEVPDVYCVGAYLV